MLDSILKEARKKKKYKLRELSALTGIDQALISKYERGRRIPTFLQLEQLSKSLDLSLDTLHTEWLAVKIMDLLQHEPGGLKALQLAASRMDGNQQEEKPGLNPLPDPLQTKLDVLDMKRAAWMANQPESEQQLKKIRDRFDLEDIYACIQQEGSTLTREEAIQIIYEGQTITGRSLQEHQGAINHFHAIRFIRDVAGSGEQINQKILLEINHLLLKEIDPKHAGQLRALPSRLTWSGYALPAHNAIEEALDGFFAHCRKQESRMHPVILASDLHWRLIGIYPFGEGNERTARLLMDLVLIKHGYPPALIKGDPYTKAKYYQALDIALTKNNPIPFYELVLAAVEASLNEHLGMI